jgi:5-methylcytosine-specific restriction endonuclease McrA
MTQEERDRSDAQRRAYQARNRARLNEYASQRRAEGKGKGTSYYRARQTPEQREAELAYKRRRYAENREAALAYAAQYREENYERLREEWRGSYQRRKEYFDRYNRDSYDRIRARRLAWTEANRERIKQLNAEWTQNNLDRHRLHQHKRRARLKAGGTLSPDIIETLMVKQRGRCACCGERLRDVYHLDHVIPLVMGGANTDDNVQLLTPRCNLQKGAKHPIEFMQRRRGMLL